MVGSGFSAGSGDGGAGSEGEGFLSFSTKVASRSIKGKSPYLIPKVRTICKLRVGSLESLGLICSRDAPIVEIILLITLRNGGGKSWVVNIEG